jgi:hypothetical protein
MGAELYEAYVTFIVTRVVLNLAVIMASWLSHGLRLQLPDE